MTHLEVQSAEPSFGKIIGTMILGVLLGIPLVGYLWETVHQVLALHVEPRRLLISVPVILAFALLLRVVAKRLREGRTS